MVWNTDGNGVTFPSANPGQQMRGGPTVSGSWGLSSHSAANPIAAGTMLQVAIRVARDGSVGGTNDLNGTRCQNNVVVYNQNGSVPPFDTAQSLPSNTND